MANFGPRWFVRYWRVVSTDRRNTLSYREKMECDDGSEISSWFYRSREDGVMGPWQGADGSSTIYVGDQYRRLLLRSAKSVAARFQREHQRSAETVLSEGNRPVGTLASLSEQSGTSAQRATTRDLAI